MTLDEEIVVIHQLSFTDQDSYDRVMKQVGALRQKLSETPATTAPKKRKKRADAGKARTNGAAEPIPVEKTLTGRKPHTKTDDQDNAIGVV